MRSHHTSCMPRCLCRRWGLCCASHVGGSHVAGMSGHKKSSCCSPSDEGTLLQQSLMSRSAACGQTYMSGSGRPLSHSAARSCKDSSAICIASCILVSFDPATPGCRTVTATSAAGHSIGHALQEVRWYHTRQLQPYQSFHNQTCLLYPRCAPYWSDEHEDGLHLL